MKRLYIVLVVAGVCSLLLPSLAHADCTGMCPDGSFPCCCNGQLIGCATGIMQCFNGCGASAPSTIEPRSSSSNDSQIISELKAAIFAAAKNEEGSRAQESFFSGKS
jgi:hypothetical protein